jgi:hypothetical protein
MSRRGAVDVCVTVTGSAQNAAAIRAGGGLVGMVSNEPDTPGIDFLDFPFRESTPSFARHRALAKKHRPRYAVAPDADLTLAAGDTLELAADLDRYADTVIVVPKGDLRPADVPDRYRLGLPFAGEAFSGADVDVGAFARADRPVHVLGGSPSKQRRAFGPTPQYPGVDVASLDTSQPILFAQFGEVWTVDGRRERPDLSFRARVALSVANIVTAWTPGRAFNADDALLSTGPPVVEAGTDDLWSPADQQEMSDDGWLFESDPDSGVRRDRMDTPGPAGLADTDEYDLPPLGDVDAGGFPEPDRADRARRVYRENRAREAADVDATTGGGTAETTRQSTLSELTEGQRAVRDAIDGDDDTNGGSA